MTAELTCRRCGAVLGGPFRILPAASAAEAELTFDNGQPLTAAGTVFTSTEPMQWSEDPAHRPPLQFAPQHWLNPADVKSAVEPVDNPARLNGCCGLDGLGGPNMRCRACKAEVGTQQSDCWTCDVFIPEPAATEWVEQVS